MADRHGSSARDQAGKSTYSACGFYCTNLNNTPRGSLAHGVRRRLYRMGETDATYWPLRVKPGDAPLPKLVVVEVLYTAPSRTGHRLRSAMHTSNAIRKEEGSC